MRWLFRDGSPRDRTYAAKVLTELESNTAVVPATWALEISNVIARAEKQGVLVRHHSELFLKKLVRLPIVTDQETAARSLTETLSIAREYKLSSYDASYLELASRLSIPIATLDEDLQRAAEKADVAKI